MFKLTWRENYQKASDKLLVDFVNNPKLLFDPAHATEILVLGMIEGWFAADRKGRYQLDRYIALQHYDFVEARRIINGKDVAGHHAYGRQAGGAGDKRSASSVLASYG